MSDTPRTDEVTRLLASPSGEQLGFGPTVPRYFAQELERENAALRQALDKIARTDCASWKMAGITAMEIAINVLNAKTPQPIANDGSGV